MIASPELVEGHPTMTGQSYEEIFAQNDNKCKEMPAISLLIFQYRNFSTAKIQQKAEKTKKVFKFHRKFPRIHRKSPLICRFFLALLYNLPYLCTKISTKISYLCKLQNQRQQNSGTEIFHC